MTTPGLARTVAEACTMAADHLEAYGWIQREFGEPGGPACMEGAIRIVTRASTSPVAGDEAQTGLMWATWHTVRDHIGRDPGTWNDRDGRTADEVITVDRKSVV